MAARSSQTVGGMSNALEYPADVPNEVTERLLGGTIDRRGAASTEFKDNSSPLRG